MGWPIDMEWKGYESIKCWTHVVTFNVHLTHDLDLGFSRSIIEKNHISWMGWPIDKERKGCESIEYWTHIVTSNFDLTHDLDLGFARPNCEIAVSQDWEARLTWNERDVNWIWCWMHNGIDLGPIHRPINGSIWNSYSFQPVGQLMGYSFTDLGADGCCRSLNALSWLGLSMIQASYSNCSAHMHMYFKKKTQVL